MPCPTCRNQPGATILTMIESHIDYTSEPYDFQDNGIDHLHDNNLRVSTWRCKNGHEFTLRGKRSCTGCITEANLATQAAQSQVNQSSRMKPFGKGGNDHFRDLPMGGPGPALM